MGHKENGGSQRAATNTPRLATGSQNDIQNNFVYVVASLCPLWPLCQT